MLYPSKSSRSMHTAELAKALPTPKYCETNHSETAGQRNLEFHHVRKVFAKRESQAQRNHPAPLSEATQAPELRVVQMALNAEGLLLQHHTGDRSLHRVSCYWRLWVSWQNFVKIALFWQGRACPPSLLCMRRRRSSHAPANHVEEQRPFRVNTL